MFFRDLADLESIMHGHAMAFQQIGALSDRANDAFNDQFGAWLLDFEGSSAASGWALAIQKLAERQDVRSVALFFELSDEFIPYWEAQGKSRGSP